LLVFGILLSGCIEETQENSVDAFFCPQDHCEERALSAIDSAKSTVDVGIYSFTSKELFGALMDAQRRGVRVRVVADYTQSKGNSSVVPFLDGNGIDSRIYPKGTTLHDKFAIIDDELVLTGSYNWTTNADERNRENLVFIQNKEIAREYEDEFFRLWAEAD